MATTTPFRPMLAVEMPEDLSSLPISDMLSSPKIDGIRCICHPTLGPITRSGKPIPNIKLREKLSNPEFFWFDGELMADSFNSTTKMVMSHHTDCESIKYHIFDCIEEPTNPFWCRLKTLRILYTEVKENFEFINLVAQTALGASNDPIEEIRLLEKLALNDGYEGLILRHKQATYKNGRSTLREAGMVKVKRFADAEAVIVGFTERMKNNNEPYLDKRGYTKRSSAQDNLSQTGIIGSFICRHQNWETTFSVSANFATLYSSNAPNYIGKFLKFRYQPYGTLDAPRCPIAVGIRPRLDMDLTESDPMTSLTSLYPTLPRTRIEAELAKKTRYFPETACCNGHFAPYYTANATCCECNNIASREAKKSKKIPRECSRSTKKG